MKACIGDCKTSHPICEKFEPEPSKQNDRGRIVYSDFCLECGHIEECHEEIVAAAA